MRLILTAGCLGLVFTATAAFTLWKTRAPQVLAAGIATAAGSAAQEGPLLSNHDALPRRLSLLLGTLAR
ncbi:MAG: hypothetical protein JOY81_11555 [Alphaproteobacteria bacterium]|nr:hypothetical protein [Alphaproteobacteria bacterium]